MIYSTQLTSTGPTRVFTSSTTGAVIGSVDAGPPAVPAGQVNAITTIIVCNTGDPDLTDETVNSADLTIQLVPYNVGASTEHIIVKNLTVPAGETIFFSDERIILSVGDYILATASAADLISVTVSSMPV
jgi:hypothetical protein